MCLEVVWQAVEMIIIGSSSPHGQIYLNRMHLFYYLPQTQTQIPDEE